MRARDLDERVYSEKRAPLLTMPQPAQWGNILYKSAALYNTNNTLHRRQTRGRRRFIILKVAISLRHRIAVDRVDYRHYYTPMCN